MNTPVDALRRAIELLGGVSEAAKAVGCSPAALRYMVAQEKISADFIVSIEKATGRKVTRRQLRPDLYA
jgi:DNA-binding transcriptional regulator YdaS (Cro superfamily)